MKALIVGGGGREHALAWSLSRSPLVDELFCAPGNPGIAAMAVTFDVKDSDLDGLDRLVASTKADLVVVGPEVPLVAGIVDRLADRPVEVFGPSKAGSMIEGSKSFAKRIMATAGIATASAETFSDPAQAIAFIDRNPGPVVIKADGLAAGKGVMVCDDSDQARDAIRQAMTEHRFGDAGSSVVIEERMFGQELSVLAFSDGDNVCAMLPAQDFKRAYDADEGPNTGGMGSYAPAGAIPGLIDEVTDSVLMPAIHAIGKESGPYVGVLYAGLMLTLEGVKVVEFNCRFGDPETQALLPLLESDLAEVLLATLRGELDDVKLRWSDQSCVCVVAASAGYPGGPVEMGLPIKGIEAAESTSGLPVFHAGTAASKDGSVTAGGRVLSVVGVASPLAQARERAYRALREISFPGMWYRSDIATRASQTV